MISVQSVHIIDEPRSLLEFYQRLVFISKNFYENLYRGFPNEGCRIMKTGNKRWKYLLVNDILIHCMRLGWNWGGETNLFSDDKRYVQFVGEVEFE